MDSQKKPLVMKKLIPYYVFLFSVSRIDFILPLINDMNDIEELCKSFPKMAGLVGSMFAYTRQPHKEKD